MATKTLTDRGINGSAIHFVKEGPGFPAVTVEIRTTDGRYEEVTVNPQTALTAGERTTLGNLLVTLYNAAKTAAGWTG